MARLHGYIVCNAHISSVAQGCYIRAKRRRYDVDDCYLAVALRVFSVYEVVSLMYAEELDTGPLLLPDPRGKKGVFVAYYFASRPHPAFLFWQLTVCV